jgi:hypothetical protein
MEGFNMNIMKSPFIVIIFLIIFLSCQKDKTLTNTENDAGDSHSIPYDYPNKLGSWWIYSVYDSLQSQFDTVSVSIIDTTRMADNKKVFVWLYKSKMISDTSYVNIQNDTVTIFEKLYSAIPLAKYIFPLQVGNKWIRYRNTVDSIEVVSKDTIYVAAGDFNSAFLIKEDWWSPNVYVHILTWLVPRVGIVKQIKHISGFDFERTSWELIDYFINP